MSEMVTVEDKRNLFGIGKVLAETDEEFMEGLLKFQSGVNVGIVIGMARASGTDEKLEVASGSRQKVYRTKVMK